MFNSILTVCTGNICRSPIAEYLLKDLFISDNISIESAGIHAMKGFPADRTAHQIALDHGFDLSPHRARMINEEMVKSNGLILVMDKYHKEFINKNFPYVNGKVFLLGKWLDGKEILDPYQKSLDFFKEVYSQIDRACKIWEVYIKEGITSAK